MVEGAHNSYSAPIPLIYKNIKFTALYNLMRRHLHYALRITHYALYKKWENNYEYFTEQVLCDHA